MQSIGYNCHNKGEPDALAREHTALVCGVNRDYVGGVLDGLGCDHTAARLDPGPDRCCVRVEESPTGS